jgi:hypothetical protein
MLLLASPCLSVRLSAYEKERTGKRIFTKFLLSLLKCVDAFQFWFKSNIYMYIYIADTLNEDLYVFVCIHFQCISLNVY